MIRRALLVALILLSGTWLWLRFREVPPAAGIHPFFVDVPRVLNIAHRGASGEKAEHTWEAYDLALRDGADVLELDLRMTSDGEIVVLHDGDLKRVAGEAVRVSESTFDQLASAAGERAPVRLREVLERYPLRLNLELKEKWPELASRLAEMIREAKREDSVVVASFHPEVLEAFRSAAGPRVATAAHFQEALKFYAFFRLGLPSVVKFQVLQIPTRFRVLALDDPEFVAYAHRHRIFVHYWTIDDEVTMRHLVAIGADGVITNFPGRLQQVKNAF